MAAFTFIETDRFVYSVCWQCKGNVRGVCELHGPLLPCLEEITAPGTKNSTKFPVPSFIEIKESNIPRAGDGAFATQFIEPGRILGKRAIDGRLIYYFECFVPY